MLSPFSPIISASNVSKRYTQNEKSISIREKVKQFGKGIIGQTVEKTPEKPFWALKDVSFEVYQGEMVGLIGHNGAGKTTLLRILSNITVPTEGTCEVRGRFATLLSLGAGFDQELTGMENIYLNAALQGFDIEQVKEYTERIIEFSDLQEAIERPIKRYSSGMVSRLGFSIAIHLLPEVIFLDEVFAVGDYEFRKKATQKILELKEQHPTLILASHSTQAIKSLCDRCLLLDGGQLIADGEVQEVIDIYHERIMSKDPEYVLQRQQQHAKDLEMMARARSLVEEEAKLKVARRYFKEQMTIQIRRERKNEGFKYQATVVRLKLERSKQQHA